MLPFPSEQGCKVLLEASCGTVFLQHSVASIHQPHGSPVQPLTLATLILKFYLSLMVSFSPEQWIQLGENRTQNRSLQSPWLRCCWITLTSNSEVEHLLLQSHSRKVHDPRLHFYRTFLTSNRERERIFKARFNQEITVIWAVFWTLLCIFDHCSKKHWKKLIYFPHFKI